MTKYHYKKYPQTIKIFSDKEKNKMIASGSWCARDETCKQKIMAFNEQERENDIGFVLEKMIVIDLDKHNDEQNGVKMFNEWIRKQSQEKQDEIYDDIFETLQVVTPNEGLHIHFSLSDEQVEKVSSTKNIMNGVEILTGINQFTPAPNTKRKDGIYELKKGSSEYIKDAPNWLIDLYLSSSEKEKRNFSYDSGISTSDVEVRNTMNTIITDMFNGYGEGERHTRLVEQCGRIIYNVKRKRLTETNGKLLLYHTAVNCTPPYDDEKEIARMWNSLIKKE